MKKLCLTEFAIGAMVVVLLISIVQFAWIFVDYGWDGLPYFLSFDWLAWATVVRGVLSILAVLSLVASAIFAVEDADDEL